VFILACCNVRDDEAADDNDGVSVDLISISTIPVTTTTAARIIITIIIIITGLCSESASLRQSQNLNRK